MKRTFLFLATILATTLVMAQKSPGLALTPPMGWNSWNTFGTDINDGLVGRSVEMNRHVYQLRDLIHQKNMGTIQQKINQSIASHDVLLIRLTPQK